MKNHRRDFLKNGSTLMFLATGMLHACGGGNSETHDPNQSAEETSMSYQLNEFDHVGVIVQDLDASIAWYERHLDFKKVTEFSFPGARVAFIARGRLRLEFFQVDGATPMEERRKEAETNLTFGGINHFAIRVDDIEGTLAELKAKGVEQAYSLNFVPDGSGDRWTFIRDNQGMLIELFQPAG